MSIQKDAAMQSMIDWLADEHELGKTPAKIEHVGEFTLHDMKYYMFKYKKGSFGKWLLGVCGGYESDEDTVHCGHVFSEMEAYHENTAEEKAIAMVEMIKAYWMRQAEEICETQETENRTEDADSKEGPFAGFVLLNSVEWDPQKLQADLKESWDIQCELQGDKESLVFDVGDSMVAVSLMPAPVPDGEAERNAANNYMWKEAVEVTKTHVAHILVAVLGGGSSIEKGQLYVKVCSACLKQKNAIGIYTSGTVFQPAFYLEAADMMKGGNLPLLNWLYFGLYQNEDGNHAYTYGMTVFGKDELEVLGSKESLENLRMFLYDIADYILSSDVTLKDGDTIGFSEDQKLTIVKSESKVVDGLSLKIGF